MFKLEDYLKAIKEENIKFITEYNRELIKLYPWLQLRNYDDTLNNNLLYTELDQMPDGWRIAFGMQMCEEINQELLKNKLLDNYRILQIKEKFGSLKWYDFGGSFEIDKIINKYEKLSSVICIDCGSKAIWRSTDYILPFCNSCKNKFKDNFVKIQI